MLETLETRISETDTQISEDLNTVKKATASYTSNLEFIDYLQKYAKPIERLDLERSVEERLAFISQVWVLVWMLRRYHTRHDIHHVHFTGLISPYSNADNIGNPLSLPKSQCSFKNSRMHCLTHQGLILKSLSLWWNYKLSEWPIWKWIC